MSNNKSDSKRGLWIIKSRPQPCRPAPARAPLDGGNYYHLPGTNTTNVHVTYCYLHCLYRVQYCRRRWVHRTLP